MHSSDRVIFYINSETHILDLAGPLQVFYETAFYGHPYEIVYVSDRETQSTSARIQLTGMRDYSEVEVVAGDVVMIPGFVLGALQVAEGNRFFAWLRGADRAGATICSVCTGAFTLAQAGLLEGRECTTHWKYTEKMQRAYPGCRVLTNRLFARSGNLYTSAGLTTGIDMVLAMLEERHGPEFVYRLARELVVYIRRDGSESQHSAYLQYRSHINEDVHAVQDWIIRNLHEKVTVERLAGLVYTSPRNLTRLFKTTTGITIGQYLEKLRVEKALSLLNNDHKIGEITRQCGLASDNQLRTIIKKHTGRLPSTMRVDRELS